MDPFQGSPSEVVSVRNGKIIIEGLNDLKVRNQADNLSRRGESGANHRQRLDWINKVLKNGTENHNVKRAMCAKLAGCGG